MSSFTKKWIRQKTRAGTVYRPVIDLLFSERIGHNLYSFIVDSGADISLAPRQLAERVGLDWNKGSRITLTGISPKPECSLEGRIHKISALIPDLALQMTLPMCFANGNASYLIGREGFFDKFNITLDKTRQVTLFTKRRS
ncbi:hypothetical protein J2P12_05200 [Candidatus Bathyarchaeota archaeon]|nr:hypothetical protein [Candidatus Bathyarchaeota archaeon]